MPKCCNSETVSQSNSCHSDHGVVPLMMQACEDMQEMASDAQETLKYFRLITAIDQVLSDLVLHEHLCVISALPSKEAIIVAKSCLYKSGNKKVVGLISYCLL